MNDQELKQLLTRARQLDLPSNDLDGAMHGDAVENVVRVAGALDSAALNSAALTAEGHRLIQSRRRRNAVLISAMGMIAVGCVVLLRPMNSTHPIAATKPVEIKSADLRDGMADLTRQIEQKSLALEQVQRRRDLIDRLERITLRDGISAGDRAACVAYQYAMELENRFNEPARAQVEYRRIVALFPNSQFASSAQLRIK